MEFDVIKELKLDFLGDAWKDCVIRFRAISVKQARSLAGKSEESLITQGLKVLEDNFIGGTGISNGKTVDITKDSLDNLPIQVINKSIELLAEGSTEEAVKKNQIASTDN